MPMTLLQKDWQYTLTDYGDNYLLLDVVCGRAAVFNVSFFLNKNELKQFNEKGEDYIQTLANRVIFSPSSYEDRHTKSKELLKIIKN